MEYIRDYFSRAMDFSGEEQGDTYRRYCLIHVAGLLVLNFALPILATAVTLILRIFDDSYIYYMGRANCCSYI